MQGRIRSRMFEAVGGGENVMCSDRGGEGQAHSLYRVLTFSSDWCNSGTNVAVEVSGRS